MIWRQTTSVLALGLVVVVSGCGLRFFDRWDGEPVRSRQAAAPSDAVWERVTKEIDRLGLVVTAVRENEREVLFDWVTAPGDGELYLRCASDPVGSASLRPRLMVRDLNETTTAVIVSSEVRATAASGCRSTGQFEEWLLHKLEPSILAGPTSAEGR